VRQRYWFAENFVAGGRLRWLLLSWLLLRSHSLASRSEKSYLIARSLQRLVCA